MEEFIEFILGWFGIGMRIVDAGRCTEIARCGHYLYWLWMRNIWRATDKKLWCSSLISGRRDGGE